MTRGSVLIICFISLHTISTLTIPFVSQQEYIIPTVTLASRHVNRTVDNNKTIYYLARHDVKVIILECKSKKPNRWVWGTIGDVVQSVELEKERKGTDEATEFSSLITIHFADFNDEVQANFSCTTQMGNQDVSHPATCVVVNQIIHDVISLGPVELIVSTVNSLENCTITHKWVAPPDCPENLVVDTMKHKGVCTQNGEVKSISCNDIDHCRSLIYLKAENGSCKGTSKILDENYTNLKPLIDGNFPQVVYCALPFLDYDSWPQYLLLYPSTGENHKSRYYSSMMEALTHNSIQLFTMSSENSAQGDQAIATVQKNEFAENENVEFICKAVSFLYMKGFKFSIVTSSSEIVIKGPVHHSVEKNGHDYIVRQNVTLSSKTYGDIQRVSCEAPIWNSEDWFGATMNISIYPSNSPTVTLTKLETEDSKSVILNCTYKGWPRPIVKWSFSKSISKHNKTSHSPDVEKHDSSWFQTVIIPKWQTLNRPDLSATCFVFNSRGSDSSGIRFWAGSVSESSINFSMLEPFLVIFTIVVLLGMVAMNTYFYRRQHDHRLTKADIDNFFKGGGSTAAGLGGNSAGLNKSYDKCHYELLHSKFKIKEESQLGSGAFGNVCKGTFIKSDGVDEEVAVKMAKALCPKSSLLGLLSEIKILTYLGKHPNIVDLIGAYTAGLRRGTVYVFLELCELGSLESYLRKYKPHGQPEEVVLDEENVNIYVNQSTADKEAILRVEEWFQSDMFRWSTEIANGLEYIASKHIIHMDIATRNVLLTSEKQAKITDFGLSRRLYDYQTYVKKSQEPLPWRWMSPESLKKFEFTEKSDVWAFGITLWEIFSLGEIPYQGLSWDMNFANKLERGLRLETPKYGRDNIYSVMLRCWTTRPERRPTFSELNGLLGKNNSTQLEKT